MSETESHQSQQVKICSSTSSNHLSDSLKKRMTDRQADTSNAELENQEVTSLKPEYRARPEQEGVIYPRAPDMTHKRALRAQTYANTKTVAQGFLNISLLSANAGQLKVVLQQGNKECMFYELLLTMIGLSFFLQLLISYLLASKYMMELDGYEDEAEQEKAMRHNSWATFLVTVVTAVNVIISTFIGH